MKIKEALETLMRDSPQGTVNLTNAIDEAAIPLDGSIYTVEGLCKKVFRSEVIPGRDAYGITPAQNMATWMSLALGKEATIEMAE
jgi:hypothetical protein